MVKACQFEDVGGRAVKCSRCGRIVHDIDTIPSRVYRVCVAEDQNLQSDKMTAPHPACLLCESFRSCAEGSQADHCVRFTNLRTCPRRKWHLAESTDSRPAELAAAR